MSIANPVFKRILVPFSTLSIALTGLSSCNAFDPLDNPGSDPQYLSAARACFDKGDFACARENYSKLSSSYQDTVTAEESFISLDEEGASMGAIMEFVGNLSDKGTGEALTIFANRLAPGAGVNRRVAIWKAYSAAANGGIKNADLKNFVIFVSSLSLAAEILAEGSEGTSQVPYTYIVSPSCKSASVAACAITPGCDAPAGATLLRNSSNIDATTQPTNTQASTRQLYDAIYISLDAMTTLGAGGRFSSALNDFSSITQGLGSNSTTIGTTAAVDRCFRQTLVNLGVGTF
jgi:hypothetical protein